jgi:hypothetical protein
MPVDDRVQRQRQMPLAAALARFDPIFLGILVVGAFLRLFDVNWDQGTHIHPDERFLTMLGNATRIPSGLPQYLNPATSPLNPAVAGCSGTSCPYTFYVYGIVPVTVNKIIAVLLGHDNYNDFTLQGRVLSAICDLVVMVVLYKAVQLLESKLHLPSTVKYLAMAFYAVSVLAIQLSHFYTVDMFLNVFTILSFYFALRYALGGHWLNVGLSAVFLALAAASKPSAIYILPLTVYLVVSRAVPGTDGDLGAVLSSLRASIRSRRQLITVLVSAAEILLAYGLVAYFALRLADPYYFQSANILDPHISTWFLGNLHTLQGYDTPSPGYPPGVQWVHKPPVTFALVNLVFFGVGLPWFLLSVIGMYLVVTARRSGVLVVFLLWGLAFFALQGAQYASTMRYFIFLYPFLALFAAIGLHALAAHWHRGLQAFVAVLVLIWPLAFLSIYVNPLSRVSASQWMYSTLPTNSYILSESWDDPLPLGVPNPTNKIFTGASLPVFNADTDPSKWYQFDQMLKRGDYLVLSSNRGWGSMPTVPEWYPRMILYYHQLFSGHPIEVPRYRAVNHNGTTNYVPAGTATFRYRQVARFTSYPSLRYLGIPIDFPDQWAEEAFTVYDHPEVVIFEHLR